MIIGPNTGARIESKQWKIVLSGRSEAGKVGRINPKVEKDSGGRERQGAERRDGQTLGIGGNSLGRLVLLQREITDTLTCPEYTILNSDKTYVYSRNNELN
jgi:hypothetical protein